MVAKNKFIMPLETLTSKDSELQRELLKHFLKHSLEDIQRVVTETIAKARKRHKTSGFAKNLQPIADLVAKLRKEEAQKSLTTLDSGGHLALLNAGAIESILTKFQESHAGMALTVKDCQVHCQQEFLQLNNKLQGGQEILVQQNVRLEREVQEQGEEIVVLRAENEARAEELVAKAEELVTTKDELVAKDEELVAKDQELVTTKDELVRMQEIINILSARVNTQPESNIEILAFQEQGSSVIPPSAALHPNALFTPPRQNMLSQECKLEEPEEDEYSSHESLDEISEIPGMQ